MGTAEGYFPALAQKVLDIPTVALDTSVEACWIASSMLKIPSVAANASALPFPDNAFDVVTLAEVVEHLSDPMGAILEAQRVARRFVVLSTEEWAPSLSERQHILRARHVDAHMEKNVLCPEDIEALFGDSEATFRPQRFLADGLDPKDAESTLSEFKRVLNSTEHHCDGGVIMVAATDSNEKLNPGIPDFDDEIVELLWKGLVSLPTPELHAGPLYPENLVCPKCHHSLGEPQSPQCSKCDTAFERDSSDRKGVANFYYHRDPADSISSIATHLGISETRQQSLQKIDQEFALPTPKFDSRPSDSSAEVIPDDWDLIDVESLGDGWFESTSLDPQIVSSLLCLELTENMECSVTIEFKGDAGERTVELFLLDDTAFHFEQKNAESRTVSIGSQSTHELEFTLPARLYQPGHYLMRIRLDPTYIKGDTFRIHALDIRPSRKPSRI